MAHITMKEIRQALLGKRISYHNGFNGSSDLFIIGHVQNEGTSVRVFAREGKGWGVFIPKSAIPTMIECGEYVEHNEIERCPFRVTWRLFDK